MVNDVMSTHSGVGRSRTGRGYRPVPGAARDKVGACQEVVNPAASCGNSPCVSATRNRGRASRRSPDGRCLSNIRVSSRSTAPYEVAPAYSTSPIWGEPGCKGPQAACLLRSVTTFDVTSLAVGRAHYSIYCNQAGGIEDDVFVYRLPADRWLVVHNASKRGPGLRPGYGRPRPNAASEVTAETVMLAVQGPESFRVLGEVLGPGPASLAPRGCTEFDWDRTRILFARTGYTGEDGGECIVDADRAGELWDALVRAGATPAGLGARDTLRLEAALPLYGNDLDETVNPYEAGIGFAVSLDDGAPFTGREALVQAKERLRTRRLTHVAARDRGVLRAGYAVRPPGGEGPVAHLTSGSFSPSLRLGIGMAYLPIELANPGVTLEVDVRGRAVPVEVVRRPFYRKPRR